MHIHKWSLSDIEDMMPWERDIYVAQLGQYIIEENRKRAENG